MRRIPQYDWYGATGVCLKNSSHCSGSADNVNRASLGLPDRISALPLDTVTKMALSAPAALMPKVAGPVIALEVVKALSWPSS